MSLKELVAELEKVAGESRDPRSQSGHGLLQSVDRLAAAMEGVIANPHILQASPYSGGGGGGGGGGASLGGGTAELDALGVRVWNSAVRLNSAAGGAPSSPLLTSIARCTLLFLPLFSFLPPLPPCYSHVYFVGTLASEAAWLQPCFARFICRT